MTDYKIRLYNSLSHEKEPFIPIDAGKVRMYVCGPTVYDRAHIGNARTVVVFDMLYRLLREVYGMGCVIYARNYTDVDDKIIKQADKDGRSIEDITEETIQWYEEDMSELGAEQIPLKYKPRATEYIEQMKTMIKDLIEQGFAYEAMDNRKGHVLFKVRAYNKYGILSRRSLDDMLAGARVEIAPYKNDPMDFVLWKPSSADEPGWESPWGRGRPGWHIECSAMARDLFGDTFDIHGGGLDLQFPHHENEIAQSCACTGKDYLAKVWMHNEMLQVDGKKMSKSLGNFFTVRDLLNKGYDGLAIRYVYLMTHYRKPMDWSDKKARNARKKLDKWLKLANTVTPGRTIYQPVLDALCDDLNTPLALNHIDKLVSLAQNDTRARAKIKPSLAILGLAEWVEADLVHTIGDISMNEIINNRNAARASKDFETADWIRDALQELGIILKDDEDGNTTYSLKELSITTEKSDAFVEAYLKRFPQ